MRFLIVSCAVLALCIGMIGCGGNKVEWDTQSTVVFDPTRDKEPDIKGGPPMGGKGPMGGKKGAAPPPP